MDLSFLLRGSLVCFLVGAAAGVCCWRRDGAARVLSFGCATLGAALAGASAVLALNQAAVLDIRLELWPSLVPNLRFTMKLDALGAFFCLILALVAIGVSIYSLGYARTFHGRKSVGILGALYNLLLLSTLLVFLADNAFFFLMGWELMALTAYCLVSFEHERPDTRRAGVLYFIMSHVGAGCLVLAFLLLFRAAGSFEFSAFHQLGSRLNGLERNAAFLLFLVGFGVKAGIVPVHIWLPAAHPVAPSNVSAVMSGLLIKTGIYGLTRVFFEFLGPPPLWWGVTVLSLGTISALVGVLYALMQHDLKTLLAYHSIENIGIILMGLGSALLFLHTGHPLLATLALLAALYHTLNHALFKSLLFLGAGAVLHAAGARDMERLGGLIRRMPWTAGFFLLGAAAISALPPLNGFVSEWLVYQALLQGFSTTESLVRLIFPIGGAMLALTSALAAACFVKAFGITFLAQPRSDAAANAHEASPSMLVGQALLAFPCVVLGLFPACSSSCSTRLPSS
jgi:hydrogenase-4 component B